MPHRTSSAVQSELRAFLAENLGRTQSSDVGPLLGQAALALDTGVDAQRKPRGWHEAFNAALSDERQQPAGFEAPRASARSGKEHRRPH